jgi:hypothetical protein
VKIKEVRLRNVKGQTGDHQLGLATIIIGPNSAGKTAITTAIRLGLAGQLPPPLGKANQSLYRLAGNPNQPGNMSIQLVMEDGGCIVHEWTRNDKGAVSYNGTLPLAMRWPDSMLDFGSFLALPGAAQARALFECTCGKVDFDQYQAMLDGITGVPAAVREAVQAGVAEAVGGLIGKNTDSAAAKVAALEELVKNAAKSAADVAKGKAGLLAGLMKAAPAPCEDKHAELESVRKELDGVSSETVKNSNAWRKYERATAEWQAELATLEETEHRERAAAAKRGSDIEQRLRECETAISCPTCGHKGKDWKEHIQLVRDDLTAQANSVHNELQTALNNITARRGELKGRKPKKPDEAPKELATRNAELTERVRQLSIQQAAFDARQHWLQQRDALEQNSVEATQQADAWKQAKAKFDEWRDGMITAGIERLLDVANKFAAEILPSGLEYDGKTGEFGRFANAREQRQGAWVPLVTFGGFEQLVSYAALSVAVAAATPVKCVIMDELGRLQQTNKTALVRRMIELAKAGVIDQFIGIDVDPSDYRAFENVNSVRFINL